MSENKKSPAKARDFFMGNARTSLKNYYTEKKRDENKTDHLLKEDGQCCLDSSIAFIVADIISRSRSSHWKSIRNSTSFSSLVDIFSG